MQRLEHIMVLFLAFSLGQRKYGAMNGAINTLFVASSMSLLTLGFLSKLSIPEVQQNVVRTA